MIWGVPCRLRTGHPHNSSYYQAYILPYCHRCHVCDKGVALSSIRQCWTCSLPWRYIRSPLQCSGVVFFLARSCGAHKQGGCSSWNVACGCTHDQLIVLLTGRGTSHLSTLHGPQWLSKQEQHHARTPPQRTTQGHSHATSPRHRVCRALSRSPPPCAVALPAAHVRAGACTCGIIRACGTGWRWSCGGRSRSACPPGCPA